MVSPLRTSRPVFGLASRKASSSLSSPASAAARLSSRGAMARCTPRAPLNSSMRLHRSTNFGSAWGAARSESGNKSKAKTNGVPAFAGTTDGAALSGPVFFDGADIERRDDLGDFLGDEARGDRRAVVVQDRDQARRVDAGVVDHQGLQLRVAVLLDHEHLAVGGDEVEELVAEREAAHPQGIHVDIVLRQGFQSLMHRRAGGAVVDAAEARGYFGRGEQRLGNQGLRVLELLLQALHV